MPPEDRESGKAELLREISSCPFNVHSDDCSCLANPPKPICRQQGTHNRFKQVASASAFFRRVPRSHKSASSWHTTCLTTTSGKGSRGPAARPRLREDRQKK